jgi:hypothetical protein
VTVALMCWCDRDVAAYAPDVWKAVPDLRHVDEAFSPQAVGGGWQYISRPLSPTERSVSPARWQWRQRQKYLHQQQRAVSPARARSPPDRELVSRFHQQRQQHRQQQELAAPRPTERHVALGDEEDEFARRRPPAVFVKSPTSSLPIRAPTYYGPDVHANDRAQRNANDVHAEVSNTMRALAEKASCDRA